MKLLDLLSKSLSKMQSFADTDRIVRGTITAKHHYPAGAPASDVTALGTGKNERFVEVPQAQNSEAWSLVVEGVDKRGNKVTEETYVDWEVWTLAKVGDAWPRT